jgi:aminomethyltransferase
MSDDRRPFLYDVHVELGAKIVPFGGWEMPLQYESGTLSEHLQCRSNAVVFDVSHLGTVRVLGDALDTLQSSLSNDLRRVAPGRAQYTHLLNNAGGVDDDIIVWWMSEHEFDVMPNASNTARVLNAVGGTDVTNERCVLAVQGPNARALVASFRPDWAAVGRFHVQKFDFDGAEVRVGGTGYTGEDGIEIAVPNEKAEVVLRALIGAGVHPAGLGARDTLRLEAALPLHGHELSSSITPLEARLGWVVGWDKESFTGRAALEAQRDAGVARLLTAISADGRNPLREGSEVLINQVPCGTLSSGNYSPILQRGIGLGLLDGDIAVGTPVTVEQRGRQIAATVVAAPFVRKAK